MDLLPQIKFQMVFDEKVDAKEILEARKDHKMDGLDEEEDENDKGSAAGIDEDELEDDEESVEDIDWSPIITIVRKSRKSGPEVRHEADIE